MADFKVNKPVSSIATGTAATIGSFPAPIPDGQPVVQSLSGSGIAYITVANPDGTLNVTVAKDQSPSPTLTPTGNFIVGIRTNPLPVYPVGNAITAHFDSRGRLITTTINPSTGSSGSIDQDGLPADVNPVGTYVMWKYQSPLPVYANGDAIAPHADSRGRLLITQTDPTTGDITDVTKEATTAPAAPVGTWGMSIYRTVLPTYVNGQASILHTSINGELLTSQAAPTTATVTSVAAAVVSTTILALNASRKAATVFNDSVSETLYLKLGAAASLISFTTKLGPGAYYEVPSPVYTGIITGIWSAAIGSARITEITP